MIEFDEFKQELATLLDNIKELGEALDLEKMEKDIKELEQKTLEPGFYNDMSTSGKVLQKIKDIIMSHLIF